MPERLQGLRTLLFCIFGYAFLTAYFAYYTLKVIHSPTTVISEQAHKTLESMVWTILPGSIGIMIGTILECIYLTLKNWKRKKPQPQDTLNKETEEPETRIKALDK